MTILPTSPTMLECFRHFPTHETKEECQVWLKKDLDPSNLQKLMYSLYIIESLVQMGGEKNSDEDEILLEVHIALNFNIFMHLRILNTKRCSLILKFNFLENTSKKRY